MIRINLLEETRVAAGKRKSGGGPSLPSFDVADNVGIVVMFAGILLAAGIVGVLFLAKQATISELNEKIIRAHVHRERKRSAWSTSSRRTRSSRLAARSSPTASRSSGA